MTVPAGPDSLWFRRIRSGLVGRPVLQLWRLLDVLVPKRLDHWAFFAHPLKPGQLIENARAVFEQVKADPSIRKRVFVRAGSPAPALEGACNTEVHELASLAGLWALARSGVLLLTNSSSMDMSLPWDEGGFSAPNPVLRRRVLINLWHGIPLKRLFALANPEQRRHGDRNRRRRRERRHYDGLIASSDIDSYAMVSIFHPLPPDKVWVTGLPRNDFLRMPEHALPSALSAEVRLVRALRGNRRLVLYAPTYRDASVSDQPCYRFSPNEVQRLRAVLRRHDAVLGVRSHYLRGASGPFDATQLDGVDLLDLGHEHVQEVAPLLREACLVVTDYSSVYIDALYLDLPVLSFAYDLDHYRLRQNGLLYDMALAFPGPVARDSDALISALDTALATPFDRADARYEAARRLFFRHVDADNARRVVERIHTVISEQSHA